MCKHSSHKLQPSTSKPRTKLVNNTAQTEVMFTLCFWVGNSPVGVAVPPLQSLMSQLLNETELKPDSNIKQPQRLRERAPLHLWTQIYVPPARRNESWDRAGRAVLQIQGGGGAWDCGRPSWPRCDVMDLERKQRLNVNTAADFMCSALTAAMCHSVDNKAIKLHSAPITPSVFDVQRIHEL